MTDKDSAGTAAELDELQKRLREMRGPNVWEAADALASLRAANAQMAAALREIDSFYRQGIDDRTFAGCVGDVLKRYAASQGGPASPAAGEVEAIIAQGHKMAKRMGRRFIIDPEKLANFPASPSPGLRETEGATVSLQGGVIRLDHDNGTLLFDRDDAREMAKTVLDMLGRLPL